MEKYRTNKNGVILETRENIFSNKVDDIIATNITTYKTEKQQETYTDKKGNLKTRTINVRVPTTQRYFYHKNHLGSITAISNENGELVERYAYDVFGTTFIDKELFEEQKLKSKNFPSETEEDIGENISETEEIQIQNRIYTRYNGKGILNNSRLFTGREFDKESKLYYYRARYYDSETGRFISRDPIGIADDINLYSYVKNNSVNFVDPSGLAKKFIAQNEGNAWYLESQSGFNTGHGAMYFINGGKEYLINFNPDGSTGLNSSGNGDMFFGTVNGTNEGVVTMNAYREMITKGKDDLYGVTKIENQYINTAKLADWYDTTYQNDPAYNTFLNNCSDQVEEALDSAGFFKYTEVYGIGTPLPGNISFPGTTPGGLGYDIKVELFYKKLFN